MKQTPSTEDFLLKWRGDILHVALELDSPREGRAAFRTNIGHARIRRREIIAQTEHDEVPMAKAWTDIELKRVSPVRFEADILLDEVGIFSGKACFFPAGSNVPEWPEGRNTHIKVESTLTRKNNSIYTVFPRQFGSFREIVRRLPVIMDTMGFRIIQTLPPFPVPTTYAVMGEYGCPFAALDFYSVDPAMAEFDEYATPLDQFRELIDAVHAKRGLFLVDLPANHTGWASTLQTHHPDWFQREGDGRFISPGAWGVKWADLVALDYSNSQLRAYMADVFLFWCRNGVDGFRCDAGYMIPAQTWEYIVARVREEYPDTIFMLEGLGGELSVTDRLLRESNLDWAYSELFQTYDRSAFEWYLPGAIERSEKYGTLVHFAETHDNDRLAKGGEAYARLRVSLAALLSWQGAWGMTNGVEWYCKEKIDVHGKNDLNWGAKKNMVDLIAKLNFILDRNAAFEGPSHQQVITRGDGNTLAVVRGDSTLVLANLDCRSGATIDWDRGKFSAPEAMDLLTEKRYDLLKPVNLEPAQIVCLQKRDACKASTFGPETKLPKREILFHWQYPRDLKREVVVPEDQWIEFSAPCHFRVRLNDPETGKTLRVYRSIFAGDGSKGYAGDGALSHVAAFDMPHYKGDGTRCRRLELKMIVYTPGKAQRTTSTLLIPPRSNCAKVVSALDHDRIRRNPDMRTILSNGAGASSQVRVAWGTIASQYDSLLAANPDANCPSDRLNLWARTRVWLQREGYAREVDMKCMTRFEADPAGKAARWTFNVPCGMGRSAAFTFELSLSEGFNAARLAICRIDGGEDDVRDQVRLVLRPDIEWRSFHANTKAFTGLETLFPAHTKPVDSGFEFAPYDKGFFSMRIDGGEYHHEPQWSYNVPHTEEADRGQEGAGDLYSPGWISADLKEGECVVLTGEAVGVGAIRKKGEKLRFPAFKGRGELLGIADAMRAAMDLYIVKRDDLKTVIAGYPWFLDWGRDTFIFMQGMLAAGMVEDSLCILKAFAAFEEKGTLPNIIYGKTAGNRDTADAQLWFIQSVKELVRLVGRDERYAEDLDSLRGTCAAIVDSYISGTPNGIRVDPESALVWCPSHFTWMDTNYPACTPRNGYPVEIQALWVSALEFLGRNLMSMTAKASIETYFKIETGGYCDCLDAPNGEAAAKARPDQAVRPNQLLLVTLGVVEDKSILEATEELLVPGAIRTLNASHSLYRGEYSGDEDTSRKPAYHNGTAWVWPFALYAEALVKTGMASKETALQLLAGVVEDLNSGTIGHLPEILDGDAPHAQKGCSAQAWSVSEILRVWLKLNG